MNKLDELKTTAEIVKHTLETFRNARNDDDFLYYLVCSFLNNDAMNKTFSEIILHRKEYGLPPFESVRRARQKVQEKNPELASDEKVNAIKKANEEAFKEFARS